MVDIDKLIARARRARNQVELKTYQNIKAEFEKFQHAQILERKLSEEIQLRIIASYAKKLEDAILQFSEADRQDLVSEYRNELEVVQKLLPEPVTRSDINDFIVSDENFSDQFFIKYKNEENKEVIGIEKKNMGNAIKAVKAKFPIADGKLISDIVKSYLV